jgi:predicted RNA polymerase sigma factor
MFRHSARLPARQDGSGGLLLLEEQDRTLWNQEELQSALSCLSRSAEGSSFSRYHAEAGIAAEHCLAHRRAGHTELARRYRNSALAAAPSQAVKEALQRRLGGG